ncbi:MAG: hypothetical protein HYV09_27355 [Deltaproteobacteria bacterium]|nr:hypothetical protein [Deltaproteobacteria bacterium]
MTVACAPAPRDNGRVRPRWLMIVVALLSCSSSDDRAPAPLRIDECPAGELPHVGGGCTKVGVRECGEGFTLDEQRGCNAVLPVTACAAGTMAVPGEASCRPIAECGDGKWGEIPVGAGTVYVDAAYTGAASDGTADRPFATIQAGIDAAKVDGLVAVAEGTYREDLRIKRPLRLFGRCPQKVSIEGAATFAVDVTTAAELHGVSVTGPATAIGIAGAKVLLDRVRVHDAGDRGVDVEDFGGPTTVTLRDSLIEGSGQIGLYVEGAAVTVERSVVRGTRGRVKGQPTNGVLARAGEVSKAPSTLQVLRSVVDDNTTFGVHVADSVASIDGSVVRATHVSASNPAASGVTIQKLAPEAAPELTVTRTLIEAHEGVGVDVAGSKATIESVTVRDITGTLPGGIFFDGATGTVARSTFVDSQGIALLLSSASVELTGLRIERMQADASGRGGSGVMVNADRGTPSDVTITGTLIAGVRELGVGVFGSRLTLVDDAILGVGADPLGNFGDAVGLATTETDSRIDVVDATITRTVVRRAARAALSIFGGTARIRESSFCSALDIVAERVFAFGKETGKRYEHEVVLEDLGGNVCGCAATATCHAVSNGLAPIAQL